MSKKILLVEDEAIIAMNETQMLKKHGYEVITVYNGEKAVEMADNDPEISLILMDIDLGKGMDGTEAAEAIISQHDIPIAFLSSHTEPEVVEKTEGITSYGYIVKNSGETVLLASIKMAFRLYEAHMELKKQKESLNSALTQYEQTANELAEKEALYRNLMENSADGVELLDEEGNYLNVNQKECEMLGYSKEELLNMKIADIDPNYPKDGFSLFWKEQPKGTSILFETFHRHKNGTLIPVEVNGIFFEVNKKKYLFGVARDLTNRKRTEEALREKEVFTKAIMDHLPIGIAVHSVDPAVEFSYMNDNFPKIYRTTREALANPDVFWDVVYEDPEFRQKIKKRVENDCTSGNPEQMQWQDIPFTRSGEGPFYICARNIPIHGTKMMVSTVWDMTERKLAEDRLKASEQNLRTTLNSIGDAVISTDTEGAIIRMNPVAENLCGWSTGDARGKALEEVFHIVHAGTGEAVENPVAKVLETGKVIGLANHTMLISRDGTEYQIADSAAPIIDDKGHTTGVVLVFRDVTEEYEKGRQLKERVKELRSIEWMLSNKTTQRGEYFPEYGDLSTLNKGSHILHSVGKEHLKDIASEYLDLLETSTAIYEKNGDYALGVFSSGWCRLMDSASRKLCKTKNNREALESGKWLCHESCWEDAALAMEKNSPVEVKCNGGIKMYAVPVHADGEIVGAMNFGYGNPPTDESELETLSKKYKIPVDELRKQAKAYRPRPQFIIDYAKERIHIAAAQLGRILNLKQKEEELNKSKDRYERLVNNSPNLIMEADIDTHEIISCNTAMAKNLGATIFEVVGKKIDDFVPPHILKKRVDISHKAIETGKVQILEDERNGKYFHTTYIPIVNEERRSIQTITIDITTQKKTENLMKEYANRLELTMEAANMAWWEMDINSGNVLFNKKKAEMLGYPAEQFHHYEDFTKLVHTDDYEPMMTSMRALLNATEDRYDIEYRIKAHSGNYRWFHDIGTITDRSEDGVPVKVAGIVLDITDRKLAENKLRRNEKDLRESQRIAHIGSWRLDVATNQVVWTEELYNMYGFDPSIPPPPYTEHMKLFTPESWERLSTALAHTRETGIPYMLELETVRKDGSNGWMWVQGEAEVDSTGKTIEIWGAAQDITTRKKLEIDLKTKTEFLENITENMFDLVSLTDLEGNFLFVGKSHEILGYDPSVLMGKNVFVLVHPEDFSYIMNEFTDFLEDKRTRKVQYRCMCADGTYLWVETLGKILTDENGNPERIIFSTRDITEQRHKENILQKAMKEKEFLMRELNHRVKNNFNMVSSLISLKEGETDYDLSDLKHRIDVIKLVHEKLHQQNDIEHIALKEYFQELLESIFYSTSRWTVQIINNIEDVSIPQKAAIPLGLVVNEIATNAVKYGFTNNEEARFSVDMMKDSDGKHYSLTLSNTGNPFPEEIGLENPETMGLQLVSSLVAQLNGTIELQKKPNPVFTIRFPIREE